MTKLEPSSRGEAIQVIDGLVERIEAFPKEPNPYRELYKVGVNSLKFLQGKRARGIIRRKTRGWLKDSYMLVFHRGIFFNHLYVVITPVEEKGGIHIRERKIVHRQPVAAYKYKHGENIGEAEIEHQVPLDMRWEYGEDNYRRE